MNTPKTSRPLPPAAATLCTLVLALAAATAAAGPYTALYAFGDSLSDLGNTYEAFLAFSNDQGAYALLGYTAAPGRYDDGRWSNGPVWVEHLNNQLSLPPLQRNDGTMPLTAGTNFAFGGATTGTGVKDVVVKNLQLQISDYAGLAGSGSPTALHTMWAGGNDVIDYITGGGANTPAAIDQKTTTMAANISTALTALYNAGARHFLVANLPALGDKPDYVNTPNQAFANDIVNSFNPKLIQTLSTLEAQLSGIKVTAWDVFTDFNDLLNNPATYGFTDVTTGAFSSSGPYPGTVVANPNQHVFWDHTHPTAPGHALLGNYAYGVLIPEPAALVLASLAFIALRVQRRTALS